ncbi:MAG: hypothetical protein VW268_11035 [Rhodospirillaceae bacterium]
MKRALALLAATGLSAAVTTSGTARANAGYACKSVHTVSVDTKGVKSYAKKNYYTACDSWGDIQFNEKTNILVIFVALLDKRYMYIGPGAPGNRRADADVSGDDGAGKGFASGHRRADRRPACVPSAHRCAA